MTDLGWLDAIEARLDAATEGPWAIWRDLDYQGFLTVGQASGVIPDGETFVDGEHNPTAHVYIEADAEFIAYAPEDIAALVAAIRERDAALARVEAEATALETLARDVGLPGRDIALRLAARGIRSALAGEEA